MNTCDQCRHFIRDDMTTKTQLGECALMGDANDLNHDMSDADITKAYGWDYEGYKAGVTVGLKFGCIHWQGHEA